MADVLRQHLTAPEYYIRLGGFPFIPVFNWNVPATQHVFYTHALLLANDIAPAVTHYLLALLATLAVYALGRRLLSTTAGVVGAVIFYTLPMTTELSTAPMVEMGATLYVVLSIYALMNAGEKLESRWVILAGLLAGWAGATKLWAIMAGPAGLATIAALQRRDIVSHWRHTVRAVFLFGLAFGLVLSPWLMRNFLASGDPLWPLGFEIFHSRYWTEWQASKFANWSRGPGQSLWFFLIGPWNLTNNIAEFERSQGPLSPALLSPLLLAFVPAVWLFNAGREPNSRRLIGALAAFCLTVYAIWFQGYQQPRYIQVIHPLLSLLAGAGVVAVLRVQHRLLSILTYSALVASFAVTLAGAFAFNAEFIPVVFGRQSRQDFLAAKVSNYNSIAWSNQHLPPDAKVLFVGLSGWYYLERDYWIGSSVYQSLIPFHELRNPQELLGTLRHMKITHVLVQANSDGIASLKERAEVLPYGPTDEVAYLSWLAGPPTSVSDFEMRSIALLAGLEASGNLELIHVGRDTVVHSRTFGGKQEVQFAVYALRDP
jgi:4-amino-4-deoxy-L-arabinose transferase-like glycosyltransferase